MIIIYFKKLLYWDRLNKKDFVNMVWKNNEKDIDMEM